MGRPGSARGVRPDPPRWVRVASVDPGFAAGDSAYHAVYPGSDGRLYFTISTHRADSHARLGCFDPGTGRIVFLKDVGAALDEQRPAVPHGKIHARPGEAEGGLYLATHFGDRSDRGGRRSYPGFHILRLDMRSGDLRDLVRGPEEEGLVSGVLDAARLVYYGLTFPSGLFCRYDVRAGQLLIASPPCPERPMPARVRGRLAYRVCRTLGLDADGAVYGSCRDGTVWRWDPGGDRAIVPGVNVRHGVVPPIDATGSADSFWRALVWDDDDRCFYGIHAGTQSLFRFRPDAGHIEPLARIGATAAHPEGHDPYRSPLGLARGAGRTLYHIAHGPPIGVPGRRRPRTTAYLVSYDLDRHAFREHGPLCTDRGERVLFAESLAADARGDLYTVAWVEVADPALLPRYRRLRRQASNAECRGEIYRMMLLRLPADELPAASP